MDMGALFGMFIGSFFVSFFIAVVWLIVVKLIPPLRKRPVGTYITAMVLAVLFQLININGPTVHGLLAAALCCGLLYWQMKRAQSKLAAAV